MSQTTRPTASVLVRLLFVAFIIGLIFTPNLRTSRAEFSSPKTALANKWLAAELTEQRILTYTATPVPAGQENLFTLRLGGDNLELSDSRTGVILCSQPLVATGGVLVQGADGKTNDTLTVDFGGGTFSLPKGIHFDGGAGGFDTLIVQGGSFHSDRFVAYNSNDGSITLDDLRIDYTNIEPVTDTAAAATFVVSGTAGVDQIFIENGPIANGFQTTRVRSANGTFEQVDFANKTDVTVNGLGGDDPITLNVTTPAVGLSKLTIDGGGNANDTLNVAGFFLPGGTLSLVGLNTIGQNNIINTANLRVSTTGDVNLKTFNSDVDSVAAATGAGHFFFSDSDDLTVTTVDGVSGITSGNVELSAITTLTFNQPVATSASGVIGISSGGAMTQASGATLSTNNLLVLGAGPVTLNDPANSANSFAANVTNSISYTNAGNLNILSINILGFGSASGVVTNNKPISINTVNGTLDINQPLSAGTSTVALTAGSAAPDRTRL